MGKLSQFERKESVLSNDLSVLAKIAKSEQDNFSALYRLLDECSCDIKMEMHIDLAKMLKELCVKKQEELSVKHEKYENAKMQIDNIINNIL